MLIGAHSMVTMAEKRVTSQHLTSEQVASILGVTKRTLKNWLRAGRIPEPARNPNNNYRQWTLSDIDVARSILREEM
jgi:DNA-binding transcriptional MerR regulator